MSSIVFVYEGKSKMFSPKVLLLRSVTCYDERTRDNYVLGLAEFVVLSFVLLGKIVIIFRHVWRVRVSCVEGSTS